MKYQIRRIISFICILACGFNLVSCVKNPEKRIVVDKAEGLSKENVLPNEKDVPKDLGAPEHWQETMDRSNGFVTIEADCQVRIPEVYNTPVYLYKMRPVTNKLLKRLCDYFSGGDRLYEEPAMTKEALQAQRNSMVSLSGDWSWYSERSLKPMLERVDELIQKAPKEEERHYIKAELMAPYQTEEEYVKEKSMYVFRQNSDYYFDTEKKIGFMARVDKGRTVNPIIRAIDYDEELGSTSNFLYRQGTFVDEKWMEHTLSNQEILGFRGEAYNEYLNRLNDALGQTESDMFQREDALREANKILKALSLKGYRVTDCVKAVGSPESESWAYLDEADLKMVRGYSVYLSLEAGDLVGYAQPLQQPYLELPETTYAPSFSTEQIHMVLTEEGIQLFEWTNLGEQEDEIAENTKLLSFDEIKEEMADHLLYRAVADGGEEAKALGDRYRYTVTGVQLRAVNISAYEEPKAVWLVPAWVFSLKYDVTFSQQTTMKGNDIELVLNAIDGGYVMPRLDPRIIIP